MNENRFFAVAILKLHCKAYSTPLRENSSVYGPLVEDVQKGETLAAVAAARLSATSCAISKRLLSEAPDLQHLTRLAQA